MSCDNNVLELFESKDFVKVCAPMVRYSKLPFRALVRKYDCDLCFTPMILADSFIKSSSARDNEFSTTPDDRPLVVQFAANNVYDFCTAAEMVSPYCNGVDLNCGCPQRWAMKDGYGAHLLSRPDCIQDIVLQVRNRIPSPFTISVKIRILEDMRKTVELCRMLEATGASFITVHARTPVQRHQPINVETLCTIRDSIHLPLIANGDVKTINDAKVLHQKTKCEGIMAARGLLTNPALYSGYHVTPLECIAQWIRLCDHFEANFQTFQHHLSFMTEKIMHKRERVLFNSLKTVESAVNFLENYYKMDFRKINHTFSLIEKCKYKNSIYSSDQDKTQSGKEIFEEYLENTFLYY